MEGGEFSEACGAQRPALRTLYEIHAGRGVALDRHGAFGKHRNVPANDDMVIESRMCTPCEV